jgi:hypothetical protein
MESVRGFGASNPAVDGGELGQRALDAADAAGHPKDFVTGPECVDTVTHRFHHTRHVNSEHCGRHRLCVRRLSAPNFRVERVDSACHHPDQHLPRPG